jgi:acyl carrier protein
VLADDILAFIRRDLMRNPADVIAADTALFSARVLDSVSLLQIVTFIEDRAGVKVRPTDLVFENFDTVASMVRFVDRKLARRAGTKADGTLST